MASTRAQTHEDRAQLHIDTRGDSPYNLGPSPQRGISTHASTARHSWDDPEEDDSPEGIVHFPAQRRRYSRWAQAESPEWPDSSQEDEEPEDRPRWRRRVGHSPESLERYLLKALALLVVIGVIGVVLAQLGQIGQKAPPAAPAPTAAPQAQPPTAISQPTPAPDPKPGQGPLRVTQRVLEPSYTVLSGDTLGAIAAKFGTTVEALQSINNLADRNVLRVGQKLVIPNQQ